MGRQPSETQSARASGGQGPAPLNVPFLHPRREKTPAEVGAPIPGGGDASEHRPHGQETLSSNTMRVPSITCATRRGCTTTLCRWILPFMGSPPLEVMMCETGPMTLPAMCHPLRHVAL